MVRRASGWSLLTACHHLLINDQLDLLTSIERDGRETAGMAAQRDALKRDDSIFAIHLDAQRKIANIKMRSDVHIHNILDPNAGPVTIKGTCIPELIEAKW